MICFAMPIYYTIAEIYVLTLLFVDTFLTWLCIDQGKGVEWNPFAKKYIHNKWLTMVINSIWLIALVFLPYTTNEVFATVIIGVLTILKSIVVYNNWRIYRK